jgi:Fe-S cluster biosynthesis and repair protein YggX
MNWIIYIITHRDLYKEMYAKDSSFSFARYKFINTSVDRIQGKYPEFPIVNLSDQQDYIPLNQRYSESQVIYNAYKNGWHKDLDFIGFLQYDKELILSNGESNITQQIDNYLNGRKKAHISFCAHHISTILSIDGRNLKPTAEEPHPGLLHYVLRQYNNFFHTQYSIDDLLERIHINMECCFLMDTETFEKMMVFCSNIIEKTDFSTFKNRPGTIMERCYGLFLAFEYDHFLDLSLPHHRELTSPKINW